MSILNRKPSGKLKDAPDPDGYVAKRVTRGRGRRDELAPKRNECWQFFRGNTYVIRTQENVLVQTASGLSARGAGIEPWQVRTERPILTPFVRQEVSAATQRVPSYDVTPTNTDPQTVAAAKVAEKVALYGYHKWRIKDATEKVVTSAIVADEGFAWPYWDSTAGPVVGTVADEETGETKPVHQGELCVRTYTANEVGWEPGQRFEDSPWYFIEQVMPVDEVLRMDGLLVSELSADGTDRQTVGSGKPTSNTQMVLVCQYFERPCTRYPQGRRVTMANGKRILPEEPYPKTDSQGRPLNEPFMHKLSVLKDPDSDHDHGLVKFCLDALRTYQDCVNKQLEYKNHMVPQIFAPPGMITEPITQEPNAVFEVARPDALVFRPSPGVPPELEMIADRALADIARMFSQNALPSQVEAARAIQALLENDQNARAAFLQNLAEFHSRFMEDCLVIVQQRYTEPRNLLIVGEFGPDYLNGFMGADLSGQTQVRVLPSSLVALTRDQIKQDVMILGGQLQWITPEEGLAAIKDGTMDGLGAGYEYDRARAHFIIQKIKEGQDALQMIPPELKDVPAPPQPVVDPATGQTVLQPPIDPNTGQPAMVTIQVPGWMPRQVDNPRVHKAVFSSWMKSSDWQRLDPGQRESARLYWNALSTLEQEEAAKASAQQAAMAETRGAANAAKPGFSTMPSLPMPDVGNPGSAG